MRRAIPWRLAAVAAVVATPIGAQMEVLDGIGVAAEITGQTYCLGMPISGLMVNAKTLPPDAITLRLMVQLSYRNVGARPVILFRDAAEQIIISHSAADALRQENQIVIPFRGRVMGPEALSDRSFLEPERPKSPPYDLLPPAPDGVLKIPLDVRFQVHNPQERSPDTELLGKRVFFQLDLNHANLLGEILQDLQIKWRPYGTLWATRVRTKPLELNIPRSPKVEKCEAEFRID